MARGPMSVAHKAAISRGMKAYWATRRSESRPARLPTVTGGTISREEAARIMFGSKVAEIKIGKKRRKKR